MSRGKIYLGHRRAMPAEIFRATEPPTEHSHGRIYFAVVGPFRTLTAARIMALGYPNPCFSTVAECERYARLRKR